MTKTYHLTLKSSPAKNVVREVCVSDDDLADVIVDALTSQAAKPPSQTPELTSPLQGNLSEFVVWDIGERYWAIFEQSMTWPANADSPWKASSSDGVDIVALQQDGENCGLLLIEVKSTNSAGAQLVTGGTSSLQSDFDKFFGGAVQDRLAISVGRVLTSLRLVHRRPDLEHQVLQMIGTRPDSCPSVQVVGVLVCNRGTNDDAECRDRAFNRLHLHLVDAGWNPRQISFRTIETAEVTRLFGDIVRKATS